MEIKKTIKYDGKWKGLHISGSRVVNEDGEIIDLVKLLKRAYGEAPFDLSTTTKEEELINIDAVSFDEDEEDIDEEE